MISLETGSVVVSCRADSCFVSYCLYGTIIKMAVISDVLFWLTEGGEGNGNSNPG